MKAQRILVIGADGVIGRHVCTALAERHELILGGLTGPDFTIDISKPQTMVQQLQALGSLDAIISTAGRARFAPLEAIEAADLEHSTYGLGITDKLMGQVNLALAARAVLRPGGSITLTSGSTSLDPIIGGSSLSMVNGALEHWVHAAATEFRPFRINIVSPSLVEGTPEDAIGAFPGFEIVSGQRTALAYIRCLESGINGEVLRV